MFVFITKFTNIKFGINFTRLRNALLFVCVEVLRPSQPNGVMSSAVSLPNNIVLCTFFRQKLTTAVLESAEGRE